MSTRVIQIVCPQSGLIKSVSVCREQTIASVMGELGWHGMTLYVGDHALDPDATFVGRPRDPSLLGDDPIEADPYRVGGFEP